MDIWKLWWGIKPMFNTFFPHSICTNFGPVWLNFRKKKKKVKERRKKAKKKITEKPVLSGEVTLFLERPKAETGLLTFPEPLKELEATSPSWRLRIFLFGLVRIYVYPLGTVRCLGVGTEYAGGKVLSEPSHLFYADLKKKKKKPLRFWYTEWNSFF